ncbi:LysR substrate-binding domain-containing protein [Kineococcus sp. NPDC059986]|uniref:LysR family transcriptional regulator n=1 Tax=Kineococcus sp. NPDC059986 TaxID=3155538 RepID=UPI003450F9BF
MTLRRLEYFVAVAEQESFTGAARSLHMAQPPLSSQVRALERELGAELFDRGGRTPVLTPAGRALLPEVRRLLAAYDRLPATARQARDGSVGRLRLGLVPSAVAGGLPDVLRRVRTDLPGLEVALVEGRPTELLRRLDLDDLDVVLLYAVPDGPALASRVLAAEPLVLALPHGHRLAGAPAVAVGDLEQEPLLLPARHGDDGLRERTSALLAGVHVRVVQDDLWMVQTMVALVAAGLGCAVVPRSTSALRPDAVAYRPFAGAAPDLELVATWREDRDHPPVARFLDVWGR